MTVTVPLTLWLALIVSSSFAGGAALGFTLGYLVGPQSKDKA